MIIETIRDLVALSMFTGVLIFFAAVLTGAL